MPQKFSLSAIDIGNIGGHIVRMAVLGWISALPTAHAGSFYTGTQLLRLMQSDNYQERGVAMGYVAGAIDMGDHVVFCSPNKTVTIGQVQEILRNHLESTPSIRNMSADSIIVDLFQKLWPCQKRRAVTWTSQAHQIR